MPPWPPTCSNWDRRLGRPGDQPADLHFRPRRDQRPDLHRIENLLRHGQRTPALRLAGPLERPPRHAGLLAADPGRDHLGVGGLVRTDRHGFESMVIFTTPGFWFFLMLVGVSVFVLPLPRAGRRPALSRAGLSGHADPVLPLLGFMVYCQRGFRRGAIAVGKPCGRSPCCWWAWR